jgi:DNA-binding transcriptional LysR family regulator
MDRIEQLRLFLRVAELGSFTQAAEQLALPKANVSAAVQRLEDRLGARLLHRTTRRVALTPDGEALLERARALVEDAQALDQLFRSASEALTGRLRVDMPSRIARQLVAPALPAFLAQHPALEVALSSRDRVVDLVQEGLDGALRVGTLAPSSLVARPLGVFRTLHCASPDYLARHGVPNHPDDLAQHLAVHYAASPSQRAAPWQWQDGDALRSADMRGQVTVDNAETYLACGLAGLGLIQIPAYDAHMHIQAGELVEVMPRWPGPAMPVHWVYPHRHQVTPRLQVFSRWLAQLLAPHWGAGTP